MGFFAAVILRSKNMGLLTKIKRKEKIWYKDGIPPEFFVGTGIRRKKEEKMPPKAA